MRLVDNNELDSDHNVLKHSLQQTLQIKVFSEHYKGSRLKLPHYNMG
jgi:hypothetical protein